MVKSSTDKFPENKLWGDGWGWSWFDADNPTKNDIYKLPGRLPGVPHSRQIDRLDLRTGLPAAQ
ncbi:hypothetical protein ACFSKM_02005 [Ancylobacter dichloromethanicus]